jgi:hypothetical protein
VLTRMLAPAPYQVSAKGDKEESKKAKGGLYSKGTPDTMSGEIGTPSSEDKREGETDIPSPDGKKRAASEDLEAKAPSEGRCPCQVARVQKMTLSRSSSVRTSP